MPPFSSSMSKMKKPPLPIPPPPSVSVDGDNGALKCGGGCEGVCPLLVVAALFSSSRSSPKKRPRAPCGRTSRLLYIPYFLRFLPAFKRLPLEKVGEDSILVTLAPTSAGGKEKCATQYGIFSSFCPGPDLFGPDPLSISALAFISYIAPLLLK